MEWDLYDKNFKPVDKVINEIQFDEIPDGYYHMTVNVWIINSNNQVLLLRKSLNFNLRYPGLWTSINGNVESGQTSIESVKQIVKEKIGLDINDQEITEVGKEFRDPHHYIFNTFVIKKNIDLKNIKINEKNFSKVKWADIVELENMINNGEIEVPLIDRIEKYIKPIL